MLNTYVSSNSNVLIDRGELKQKLRSQVKMCHSVCEKLVKMVWFDSQFDSQEVSVAQKQYFVNDWEISDI